MIVATTLFALADTENKYWTHVFPGLVIGSGGTMIVFMHSKQAYSYISQVILHSDFLPFQYCSVSHRAFENFRHGRSNLQFRSSTWLSYWACC